VEHAESGAVVRATWQGSLPLVSSAVPRQLPAVVTTFSGRLAELAQLDSALSSGAVVISAVNGTAGVGKTALALHWAHRVADRFPDGQLYVNMRGFEPDREPMSVAEAVRGFLDAFGVPSDTIPMSVDAQTALFRSKIAQRRVLLVLDNVNNAVQVRALLPGGTNCFVLITSRDSLAGLVAEHNARPLRLDLLSDDEAAALLRDRLGDVDTAELVELCAGLPLALSIVAARVVLQPAIPIAELVDELRADRLEALDLGEVNVSARAVFCWSLRSLSEPAANLFRLLGLHPGPDIDTRAAAALAGLPVPRGKKVLRELVGASLLDEYLPGRFRFHDLLRLFARELAGADEDAQRRMLGFYVHTAWAGDRALVAYRVGIELPPLDSAVSPLTFVDRADAWQWFTAERAVLVGLVGYAAASGLDQHAWQLAVALRSYLDTQGHLRDCVAVYRAAIAPASRLADPIAQVRVHRGLGRVLLKLSREKEAEPVLKLAADLAEGAADRQQQAYCRQALSMLYLSKGMADCAAEYAADSVRLYPQDDDPAWLASSYVLKGQCLAELSQFDAALEAIEHGLGLHRKLVPPDEFAHAEGLICAARVHLRLREFVLAREHVLKALALYQYLGNLVKTAEALECVADVHRALGRHDEARIATEDARAILEGLRLAAG
jgi:tetratricopeptide (TPR) repeat protein